MGGESLLLQKSIPLKDGAVLSNCPDREVRRQWIIRILEQDGTQGSEGGNGGLDPARRSLWPDACRAGERGPCPAWCTLCRRCVCQFCPLPPWQEAVCSSLTELFAPDAHVARLEAFPKHYPWVAASGLEYFSSRLTQARRDVDHGLRVTLDYSKRASNRSGRWTFCNSSSTCCGPCWTPSTWCMFWESDNVSEPEALPTR